LLTLLQSTPKILPKFFSLWNRFTSTWNALIHSILIGEAYNMKNFVFQAITTSFRKKCMTFAFELSFHNIPKKQSWHCLCCLLQHFHN
jgi:hypothetical protein